MATNVCGGRFCGRNDHDADVDNVAFALPLRSVRCISSVEMLNLLKWHNNLTCTDNDLKSAVDDINCVTWKRHDRMTAVTNDANNARVRMHTAKTGQKKRSHQFTDGCSAPILFYFLFFILRSPVLLLHLPRSYYFLFACRLVGKQ